MMPYPEHVVRIEQRTAGHTTKYYVYTPICNVCGRLMRPTPDLQQAQNRKSTHDRGQDAGAD